MTGSTVYTAPQKFSFGVDADLPPLQAGQAYVAMDTEKMYIGTTTGINIIMGSIEIYTTAKIEEQLEAHFLI